MGHWKQGYGCPYCGKDINDEDDYAQDDGVTVLTCAACGKRFRFSILTIVKVHTRRMRQAE